MTFSRRLARLEATAVVPASSPPTVASAPVAAAPGSARPQLAELREQLQALLTRGDVALGQAPRVGSQRARQRQLQQLPFVRKEQPGGPLWQRTECLTGAHRIGHIRLDQLERAQPAVLA